MIPYVPHVDRGEALSRFEQMVLGRLGIVASGPRPL